MYTNIDTDHALEVIATFLRTSPLCADVPSDAIIAGLEIIMRNNIFRFGDTFWHQRQGTAMGTPPAPPYATLYFGIHELETVPFFEALLKGELGRSTDAVRHLSVQSTIRFL